MDTDQHPLADVTGLEQRNRPKTEWPWYGQLVVLALLLAAIVVIFLVPSWIPGSTRPESITGYVAMTAVLISGTFLFMTFRMDRNATNEARSIVHAAVESAKHDAIDAAVSAAVSKAEGSARDAVEVRLREIVAQVLMRNLDVLREVIGDAVSRLLPSFVDNSVTVYLNTHLGDRVSAALQSERGRVQVLEAVRLAVGEQLDGALGSVLPEELNKRLPALAEKKLPPIVKEQLTSEVIGRIVASDELKEAIARRVEERLPAIVEKHFSTHWRRFWRPRR